MINTGNNNVPTNATQTKERLYAQLALSLGRMSRAVSQTADLCEQLQVDLHAIRILAGLDAAKYVLFWRFYVYYSLWDRRANDDFVFAFLIRFMTVAAQLNPEDISEQGSQNASDEKEKE